MGGFIGGAKINWYEAGEAARRQALQDAGCTGRPVVSHDEKADSLAEAAGFENMPEVDNTPATFDEPGPDSEDD